MSFLSPLFLIGALAAAVPIVLHMLKREPEARVRFAAVKLLRRAPVEQARHRRLRELLLLALRVTALVLLALAFARPFFASAEDRPPAVTVVALDTSLSMGAPGQFERARQLARDAIGRAPSGHHVALVTFDDGARVVAGPAADRSLVMSAIDRASAGFGATRYHAALAATAELIAQYAQGGTVVIVGDLQENGWDASGSDTIPTGTRVEVVDVGAPPPNVALTALVRAEGRLTALVRNDGAQAHEVRVQLTVDGKPAGEALAPVGANQLAAVPLPAARGRAAIVSVDDRQGIPGDNRRYALLSDSSRPAVAVITASGDLSRDAFYLQQALMAGGSSGPEYDVEGIAGGSVAALPYTAIVLSSTQGLDAKGRTRLAEYVRGGGGLFVALGDEVDPAMVSEVLGVPGIGTGHGQDQHDIRLAPADVRHPIFRAFGSRAALLGSARFDRTAPLQASTCARVARFTNGESALVECPIGKGRALVLASDLSNRWNDFPLQASFVPFVRESMGYLAAGRAGAAEYMIGDSTVREVVAPGIVTLPASDGVPARQVVVNVDPDESVPGRLSVADFESAVVRLQDDKAPVGTRRNAEDDRQQLWRYLLLAVMAALLGESAVAARTA